MRLFIFFSFFLVSTTGQAQDYLSWIQGPDIDLGEVSYKKGDTAKFIFKNTGKDSLTIETVRTTCSCTAVDWQKEPIAPNETTTLTIRFKPNSAGSFKKTIKLFFYQKKKVVRMKLEGEVVD